jgi:hypothetical protein
LSVQGLVGTVRADIDVKACGSFIDYNIHFVNKTAGANETTTPVNASALRVPDTYQSLGWDLDDVWIMPPSGAAYKLPILRGLYQSQQEAISMPQHLS